MRIKSLDWYNEHTLIDTSGVFRTSIESLCPNKKRFMEEELTICSVLPNGQYLMKETGVLRWTDEMIEGLAEDLLDKEIQEHQKICNEALTIKGLEPTEEVWHCPEGYQFVDENGNVLNATKIVLEKKKKEPTYRPFKNKEECWAEMQKHQPFGWLIRKDSNAYCYICVIFSEKAGFEEDYIYDYKYLYNNYTFADGKPFGIKED